MPAEALADPELGYVSRYALGRDYHKVLRNALQGLADDIVERVGPMGYRVFVDSGPVLEKALARNAGLGWIGKHTNLIARDAGSYFFIGEILTDLPLPVDEAASAHCGTCSACIPACPTGAITAPNQLDARRCISYLTIELHGAIPVELRRMMGNRIYGCDDCQLVCPWNKFARAAAHPDFKTRHRLDSSRLDELFAWTEAEFLERTEGSAIRRIGYERWLRNIAVALGNAPATSANTAALAARAEDPSALVREHVAWALAESARRCGATSDASSWRRDPRVSTLHGSSAVEQLVGTEDDREQQRNHQRDRGPLLLEDRHEEDWHQHRAENDGRQGDEAVNPGRNDDFQLRAAGMARDLTPAPHVGQRQLHRIDSALGTISAR